MRSWTGEITKTLSWTIIICFFCRWFNGVMKFLFYVDSEMHKWSCNWQSTNLYQIINSFLTINDSVVTTEHFITVFYFSASQTSRSQMNYFICEHNMRNYPNIQLVLLLLKLCFFILLTNRTCEVQFIIIYFLLTELFMFWLN